MEGLRHSQRQHDSQCENLSPIPFRQLNVNIAAVFFGGASYVGDAQPNSFWEKNTRNSSSDYDGFTLRKNREYTEKQRQAAKKRAEELFRERKRLEEEAASQAQVQSALLKKILRAEA